MSNKIKFTYQASDGYVGGSRPQTCSVMEDEILECECVEDAVQLVEDAIQDDFLQKVSADYDLGELEDKIRGIFAKKAATK